MSTLLIVLGLAITQAQAQLLPAPPPTTTEAGRLIIQFWQNIKPESFTDQWQLKQKSWAATAAKTPTAIALAKNASFLASYIKPEQFKSNFNLAGFISAANKSKTYAETFQALKSLEEGLKPGTFVGLWANRRGHWLNALSALK